MPNKKKPANTPSPSNGRRAKKLEPKDSATAASSSEVVAGQPEVNVDAPTEAGSIAAEEPAAATPVASPTLDVHAPVQIAIDLLDPHPENPRLGLHEPTVTAQTAQMQARGEFDRAHAIMVRRKSDGRYEIISGHTRVESARRAGLACVWAFVVVMDDDEARLALATANVQEPLTALEIGIHSLGVVVLAQGKRGLGLSEYARRVGLQPSNLRRYRDGGEVFQAVRQELGATSDNFIRCCRDRAEHLAAIHRAKPLYWAELVNWLVTNDKATIAQTEAKVGTYLPAGEENGSETKVGDAGNAQEPEKAEPNGQGPENDSETEVGDVGNAQEAANAEPDGQGAVPAPATKNTEPAPGPESNDAGQVAASEDTTQAVAAPTPADTAETHGPTTAQETNATIAAKYAATEAVATPPANQADEWLSAAIEVFHVRWEGFGRLRRLFPSLKDPVLRRALSAWDNRLAAGRHAPPEETIRHLATQDGLARQLAQVGRECDELAAATPRGRRKLVEPLTSVICQLRASSRDLAPEPVADLERRLGEVRTRLANVSTPIESAIDTIARRS